MWSYSKPEDKMQTYTHAQTVKGYASVYLYEIVFRWAQEKLYANCLNLASVSRGVIYSRLWQERLGGYHLLLSISLPASAKLNNKFTPTV